MRFVIVFPISTTRLHVMYDTLEGLRYDALISRYIDQIEALSLHQSVLIDYKYFITRIQ